MRGIVKVKVGPITAQYKGQATFIEQNKDAWKIVIEGKGRDARGSGDASALITAQLTEIDATSTKLDVTTDLALTGKVASFGGRSGVMEDVSSRLMGQFADNFETMMDEAKTAPQAPAAAADESAESGVAPKIRKVEMPEPEAVDLLEHAGAPVMKAIAPIAVAILLIWLLRRIFGGNRG